MGAAIVDTEVVVSESFIKENEIGKGLMTLVDADRQKYLIDSLTTQRVPVKMSCGGSACNSVVAASMFGSTAFFSGKVASDEVGDFFVKDLNQSGVDFHQVDPSNGVTGKCLVMVTPDAERSMVTFLGSSKNLSKNDIDEKIISLSRIVYLEGYLFDPPEAQKAFKHASDIAHNYGSLVAFTLSDSFCVDRHREEMKKFILNDVNILLCNEAEILSLYQLDSVQECTSVLRREVDIAVITMGEKGAKIVDKNDLYEISAFSTPVVDTTGAGDFFAAGFLAGLSKNFSLKNAGVLGSACSAEIISHYGARPEISLEKFIQRFDFHNNM